MIYYISSIQNVLVGKRLLFFNMHKQHGSSTEFSHIEKIYCFRKVAKLIHKRILKIAFTSQNERLLS